MRSLKTSAAVMLLLLGCLLPMTSCKKDKFVEEITPEETGLETNKDVLLSQLSRQDVINFFDLDFIEQTNPNLEGTPGLGEDLPAEIEAVYLDFLIKNGATNFVPNIIPNVGYAMWRRVEVYQDDNDGSSTIVIPFATLDGDSTNAIMVAIPFEVDDFYVQQGVNRPGYYYLTTTRSELATALEDHPKINDDNVYSNLLNFLVFDESIFSYVNPRWYEIYQEYDDGFTSNGTEKGTCSSSYTACVFIYAFSPGGSDDKSCINTVITYTWECPGGNGGFIPGGTIGSGGGISSGGGGSQSSALDALNRLIAECSSETSPDVIVDNPQHGGDGGNCRALLAAIENLGYDGLSPEMWLLLFQEGEDLLDLAATISPEDQRDFALYLNFFIPGITQQNFIAFQTNLAQVEALQAELDLDVPTFMWLLQQVISVGARENNVADEIEAFLNDNNLEFQESATEAARIYIELTINDEEFRTFDEEFEAAPVWWFPFVKEIAKEAVLELLRRRVNGSLAGLPQDVLQAIDAISEGDILGVLGESLDIAKRFFPALQGIDTFFDGVELLGEGTRAWRAISKLRNFGDEVIQNVLTVVRQRTGGLLGKITWINNGTGAFVNGIPQSEGLSFFQQLINLFPGATVGTSTNPNNTLYNVLPDVSIEFQPTSTSTPNGAPTISIRINSYTVKLRLQP